MSLAKDVEVLRNIPLFAKVEPAKLKLLAFTSERLDAVTLVAGQLAVSLDNAQLYAELVASRARIVAASDTARRRCGIDLLM